MPVARIAICGAGHVGLVYAAGLAELGHSVSVVDIDRERVAALDRGEVWFYEPGLADLLASVRAQGSVRTTTRYDDALSGAEFVFICVPTPPLEDGELDERPLRAALAQIRAHARPPLPIVVNKSTVPPGSAERILEGNGFRVVASPEFLAQGRALADLRRPARIVLGSRDRAASEAVRALFHAIDAPTVYTDSTTAELAKLAANGFLAMKVSYVNAVATLAESVGADTDGVLEILSLDPRIGQGHARAGLGYGGSCLPKDVGAIEGLARKAGAFPELFAAVPRVNDAMPQRALDRIADALGGLRGRRIAVLGITYKAGTDDVHRSPALRLAREAQRAGADVVVFDPCAPRRADVFDLERWADSPVAAVRGADAVVFGAEWPQLASLDLAALRSAMRGDVLFDGRGIVAPQAARESGLHYLGLGRGGRPNAS